MPNFISPRRVTESRLHTTVSGSSTTATGLKLINFNHLGGEPTTMAWQLFERNSLRPHVPPFVRSPSMGPKIETCNNTSHTCPIIFSHTLLYDHRRTITITRRDPTCFLRRFLLGDRRRNTALLIPLARTLCCLFFCFCFSLLIWSLLPISFFSFGYPNALTYCCPLAVQFFFIRGRRSIMANTWTWLLHNTCLLGGVDFAGDETCHF
jgi:hypothetical protein